MSCTFRWRGYHIGAFQDLGVAIRDVSLLQVPQDGTVVSPDDPAVEGLEIPANFQVPELPHVSAVVPYLDPPHISDTIDTSVTGDQDDQHDQPNKLVFAVFSPMEWGAFPTGVLLEAEKIGDAALVTSRRRSRHAWKCIALYREYRALYREYHVFC